MSDIKSRISVVVDDVNNLLAAENCNGFPYLKLNDLDYTLKPLEAAYSDYIQLIKKLGYEGNWKTNKISFFDIHPVFSNAAAIPSLMGFHLSLLIFQRGLAGATETLYFDTASNWLKFSRIEDHKAFNVCSWIKYKREDIFDHVDEDSNPEVFLPVNLRLFKGVELSSIEKHAPTQFDLQLLNWYKEKNQLEDNDAHRVILLNEISLFKKSIEHATQVDAGKFESAAQFLFALIFCREFGFSHDVFISVTNELKLSFDFSSDLDLISYTHLCFRELDQLKLRIGEYSPIDLTRDQVDLAFAKEQNSLGSETEESIVVEQNGIKPIEEKLINYQVQGLTKFFNMKPALVLERDCRIEITKIWTRMVQCYYLEKLTQDSFNFMRNIMDTHIQDVISHHAILQRKNREIQLKAMQDAAYSLFLKTEIEYRSKEIDTNYMGDNLYEKLKLPPLTSEQENLLNLMNSSARKEHMESIYQTYKEEFIVLLKSTIAKFGHSSTIKEHGSRFAKLDSAAFRRVVLQWYVENYIQSYIDLNNEYKFVFKSIEMDKLRFNEDDLFKKALYSEIKTFAKTKDNPFIILDINKPL